MISNYQKFVREVASSFVLCFLIQNVNPSYFEFGTANQQNVA